jgi:hypothetical protein
MREDPNGFPDDRIFNVICGVLAGVDLARLVMDYGPEAFDYTNLVPELLLGEFSDYSGAGTPEEIVWDHFAGWARRDYDILHVARAYRRTISGMLTNTPVKLIGRRFYTDHPADFPTRHRHETKIRSAIAAVDIGKVVQEHGPSPRSARA